MSTIKQTWATVRRERDRPAAPNPLTGVPLLGTAYAGIEWTSRLYRPHDVDPNDIADICEDIYSTTVNGLTGTIDAFTRYDLVKLGIGAGVFNGVILGLEHEK